MHSLPIFVTLTGQDVVVIGDGAIADAKRRLVERAGGVAVSEDHPGARIAFVAVENDAEAEGAAGRLRARGLLVNVADRPALCDFTLPAIVDRDPVLVAIGTGGRSAGLAKALRQRFEALLPADLGSLAQALFGARGAIRARWSDADSRRRAIDAGLSEGGPIDPLVAGGAAALPSWLAAAEGATQDRLAIIRLRSRDPDELTLAEARLLGQADRIFHRPDVPAAILSRGRADARRTACSCAPAVPGTGLSIDIGFA